MQRLKLLAAMLALCAICAAVLVFASPYAPVVAPVAEIEEIWAIEDARQESEGPLVTALENNGVPLAYDAEQNTFYCTLGMGNSDAWPQIHLTAPGAKDVSLVFADDYSYDWCQDAIRDGYGYEVMAYTETEYAYFYIVFTGLPQLCIDTGGQEISMEDSPIRVTMSAYGEEPLASDARIHLRGASTLLLEKQGYKIEFTRRRGGEEKKIALETPGFGYADDLALLPCLNDATKMRDKLNWELYAELAADGESFGARTAEYVEVFKDGEYFGLYVMIEPTDMEEELSLGGEDRLLTDSVYRTAALNFSQDREYYTHPIRGNAGYELYYAPPGADKFAGLEAYIDLVTEEDDEAFCEKALARIDIDSMVRHVLLMQGAGICDNFFNNMFIWSHPAQGGVTYRFSCWDLDMAWGFEKDQIGEEFENWLYFPVADRMINLDVGGIRQKLYDQWQQMRAMIFNEEKLEERIAECTAQLNDSGAFARDAERWGAEVYAADGYELIVFAALRWPLLDEAIALIAGNGGAPVEFLSASEYNGKKGGTMRIALGGE